MNTRAKRVCLCLHVHFALLVCVSVFTGAHTCTHSLVCVYMSTLASWFVCVYMYTLAWLVCHTHVHTRFARVRVCSDGLLGGGGVGGGERTDC